MIAVDALTPMGVKIRHRMRSSSQHRPGEIRREPGQWHAETPTMPRVPCNDGEDEVFGEVGEGVAPLALAVTDCTEKTMMSPKVSSNQVEMSRQ